MSGVEGFGPIERDEAYERDYIPIGGGWEIQTKGKGSTFRISDGSGNRRLAIPDSPYLHETLTKMAREVHAAHVALLERIAALEGERAGWVLVPRKPTLEMLLAAEAEHPPAGKAGAIGLAVEMYRAMLSAAPPLSKEKE